MTSTYDEAEIGDAVVDRLKPGVTTWEENKFNRRAKCLRLSSGEVPVEFERDEVALPPRSPFPIPDVVLPGGEKHVRRRNGVAVVKLGAPLTLITIVIGVLLIQLY